MATACPCGRGEAVGADEVVARSGEAVETEACVRAVHGRPRRAARTGAGKGTRAGAPGWSGRFQQRQRGEVEW